MPPADDTVILGISCDFHDAAAALLVDGRIVTAAEEERFTRVKHDARVPESAVRACLETAGLTAGDIDHVVFYEKPLMAASRFLATRQRQGPGGLAPFVRDAPKVFGSNLLIGLRIGRMLQRLGAKQPPPVKFIEHHLSHAASAFLPSPFEHSAILTIDGIGEWATATIGQGHHHRVELLAELRYPDSLGLLYSFVTAYCGFRPNDDEYKLMGLASYGTPRFVDDLTELMQPRGDGSVAVDARALRWFSSRSLRRPQFAKAFDGPPRQPGDPVSDRDADLAASIQALTETAVLQMAARARELTGEDRLCLAGGVALNCVANGRILREGPFDEIWVQPAAGDSGGAIGAALAYWHLELGNGREVDGSTDAMSGSFLGPDVDSDEVEAALSASGVAHRDVVDDDELADEVSRRLADGDVVGWFRGRMEFGPRALGHRSLLADPRSATVRARLNEDVKGREDFRPFAPAVLADRADEWFDLDATSPYMLVVAQVADGRMVDVGAEPGGIDARGAVSRSEIPACTHVDGSARIQTVDAATNPDLARLLRRFDEHTGCPILLNTSFNRAGEPIVATPEQAINSARAGGIDLLVLGNSLVEGADLRSAVAAETDTATEQTTSTASERAPFSRLVMAFALGVVPLWLRLHRLEFTDHSLRVFPLVVALFLIAGWRRWTASLVVAAGGAAWLALDHGVYFPAKLGLSALAAMTLAAVATGAVRVTRRRDGSSRRVATPTLLMILPLFAVDAVLLVLNSVIVPDALLYAGVAMILAATAFPTLWSHVERMVAPLDRVGFRVLRRVDTVLVKVFVAVGGWVSVLLLGVAYVPLVLVPWTIQRVIRWDPLWAPHTGTTRWVERLAGNELRPADLWFADPAPSKAGRRRSMAYLSVGVLVVGAAVAAARLPHHTTSTAKVSIGSNPGARDSTSSGSSTTLAPGAATPTSAAVGQTVREQMIELPWWKEWSDAYQKAGWPQIVSQYTGTELHDVTSKYLKVKNGLRASWSPPAGKCRSPIRVWFFGGSAPWGVGARDDFTPTSELIKAAYRDHVALDVSNMAVPGDVEWIQERRLERALGLTKDPPDMVVFLDGFNDIRAPDWVYMAGRDPSNTFSALNDRDLLPLLSTLQGETADGKTHLVTDPVNINVRPSDWAAVEPAALFQYTQADQSTRIFLAAKRLSFLHFFQPMLSTRDVVAAGELPWSIEARARLVDYRKKLPLGVIDMSNVFDGNSTPFYEDDVHLNEAGNVPIGARLWKEIKPSVEKMPGYKAAKCS